MKMATAGFRLTILGKGYSRTTSRFPGHFILNDECIILVKENSKD